MATAKQPGKNPNAAKQVGTKASAGPVKKVISDNPAYKNKSGVEKVIQDITNRYRVTAKEARDIVTAVGTVGATRGGNPTVSKAAGENLKKQVKEVAKAATTGKKGTTSDIANPNMTFEGRNKSGRPMYSQDYKKGKQR